MNVLIVEDDNISSTLLFTLIKTYDENIYIHPPLNSVKKTIDFFKSGNSVDLAFFDIHLSDGKIFEVFKEIDLRIPIIFTSAYENHTLQAFKVNSIDYLLKPIAFESLSSAINQFKRYYQQPIVQTPSWATLEELNRKNFKKRFLVKVGDNFLSIAVKEIAFFFADGKTTYLIPSGSARRYVIDYTLENLETSHLDPSQFFRINRKFIVNVDALSEVKSYVNGRLKVLTEQPSPIDMIVSRERVNDFKSWLNQ